LAWAERFFGRAEVAVVPLGRAAALATGRIRAAAPMPAQRRGGDRRKPERRVAWVFDIQIAATAWAAGLPVATENLADYERIAGLLGDLFPRSAPLEVQPSPL
jgi:predicted nucleic acid-binding protein